VIEMNPRVSRSSALASKATGFPIAKVAAKLAVGYTLDEIQNDITGCTPGQLRADDRLCRHQDPALHLREVQGLRGAALHRDEVGRRGDGDRPQLPRKPAKGASRAGDGPDRPRRRQGALRARRAPRSRRRSPGPTPDRLLVAAQALREGFTVAEIHAIAKYDPWFLERLKEIVEAEEELARDGRAQRRAGMRALKAMGFPTAASPSCARSAGMRGGAHKVARRGHGLIHDAVKAMVGATTEDEVRELRHRLGVRPVFKRVDSVAAEFAAKTPYMYSTYEAPSFGEPECESEPTDARKIVILGGGPNRIGQGIEFDYCCVHAAYALRGAGFETIMINCNPETVSTDYDTSDRLYFEPLTAEDVLEVLHVEASRGELVGVIVQLAARLHSSLPPRWRRRAFRSWVPRRMRSILPRIANALPACRSAGPEAAANGMARSRRRRSRSPSGSAIRC
jgi:carbamoyl-phosphate synthase large subunit